MAVATASPSAVGDAAASSSGKAAAAGAAPPHAQQQPHTTTSVGDAANNNTSTSSSTTSTATTTTSAAAAAAKGVTYRQYVDEHDLPAVMALVDKDLSEPYSVFTYRYFLAQWPQLCFLAHDGGRDGPPIGVVVCKVEPHRGRQLRGYLAMLVVDKSARGRGVGAFLFFILSRLRVCLLLYREKQFVQSLLACYANNNLKSKATTKTTTKTKQARRSRAWRSKQWPTPAPRRSRSRPR